jgi:hypothetical protein
VAGRGPAPKETRSRERDQRQREESLMVVVDDGKAHGPALPDTLDWPAATLTWWETWRRSPQAQMFTDTDWSFLLDTAVLHAEFWMGNRSLAAELRLRAAKFGATPEDRARLKLEVGDPSKGATPRTLQPKQKDRRERLLKAVEGGGG